MKQILVFILFSALLCWFMFSPIYKHVLIVRQAVIQKEVDLLLEVGANGSHGYISEMMLQESRQRLAARGFISTDLQYTISTSNGGDGTDPARPVLRGIGIQLLISYPYQRLFDIDRLIGISPPDVSSRMTASGMKMSEYVP
ncbi:MAG: hypothetical protein WD424_03935 [Paenibacillaceae bacterium]